MNDNIHLTGVSPIDVSCMSIQKYGSHDRPPNESGGQKRKESKKYSMVQEKVEEDTKKEKIVRKDCSLQEHMQFMIWIGQKNKRILQD